VTDHDYPADLRYHEAHDWARIDGQEATFGITRFAQNEIGELVFIDLPAVDTVVTQDDPYAEVESVKAVSDVIAPLSGRVIARNERAVSDPGVINADPYGDGWLIRVELGSPSEAQRLLDAVGYEAMVSGGQSDG
jgi:glycine cleavage system H protein